MTVMDIDAFLPPAATHPPQIHGGRQSSECVLCVCELSVQEQLRHDLGIVEHRGRGHSKSYC